MKKNNLFSRLLILSLFLHGWNASWAQPPATAKYRWPKNAAVKFSADLMQAYQQLPEADYTPPNDIGQWSAAERIRSFAGSYNGNFQLQCILVVDEKGTIRNVKIIKSSDAKGSGVLKAILTDSKAAGPSFDHNKAVSCYVPCSITIISHQLSIS